MAVLVCDICGGKLVMGTGGIAVCDSCGMEHSKDRMQEKVQEIKGTVAVSNIAGIESLMKRGHLALEDKEWTHAIVSFNKILELNPEYAPAYAGKLCVDISHKRLQKNDWFIDVFKKEADLARYYQPLDDMPNYQKALRFADETYRAQLEGYNNEIKKRIAELKNKYSFFMVIDRTNSFKTEIYPYSEKSITSITNKLCLVGRLERGTEFKILRTGIYYRVESYKYGLYGDYYRDGVLTHEKEYIHDGDIAVYTIEEQQQKEEQERKERERYERKQREKQEKDERERREAEERVKSWREAGLCEACGGKIVGVFKKKCKSCGNTQE